MLLKLFEPPTVAILPVICFQVSPHWQLVSIRETQLLHHQKNKISDVHGAAFDVLTGLDLR